MIVSSLASTLGEQGPTTRPSTRRRRAETHHPSHDPEPRALHLNLGDRRREVGRLLGRRDPRLAER